MALLLIPRLSTLLTCLAVGIFLAILPAQETDLVSVRMDPALAGLGEFAVAEIHRAAEATPPSQPLTVALSLSATRSGLDRPQSYAIHHDPMTHGILVSGPDAVGVMYGGLDVADAIRSGSVTNLRDSVHAPTILQRGIKMNLPLDLRTPSYSDMSDASQANIPVVWDLTFWQATFDDMARNRFNAISFWSLHPFPSLVRVPEFPHVALDDVWRTTIKLNAHYSDQGLDFVRPEMLAHHEVVKTISIDQKMAFWQTVMRMAQERGIAVYWFTWNIFTYGAVGKDGLPADKRSPLWTAYFRASIREMIRTYPLLAGLGITAGEGFPEKMKADEKETWLWNTYGEGIRDGLQGTPDRPFRLIHRCHMTGIEAMRNAFRDLPCGFDLSFKYAIAHMYSVPKPTMIAPLLPHLSPQLRSWLTLRNDDIYSFRWADVDCARAFIQGIPPEDKIAGFWMGCDGYFWGRDFLSTDTTDPRPTLMHQQWHSFALWGRLAYEPDLPSSVFESLTAARFPGVETKQLVQAWAHASRTFPIITRFFWGDIDVRWFPEACRRKQGFYHLRDFVGGESMPGSGVMNIMAWRADFLAGRPPGGTTPREIAESLDHNATRALNLLVGLRAGIPKGSAIAKEYQATLEDIESMAHLGHYYAEKVQGACDIALLDKTGDEKYRITAIAHLEKALGHWTAYADSYVRHHVQPVLYNRAGVVDIPRQTEDVRRDIDMARSWQKGDFQETELLRRGTEAGFTK